MIHARAVGCVAFKAPSQSRSGSPSPAFASSMIFWATASRVGVAAPSVRSSVTRANSYASPMTRMVSVSNLWPWRWDRIGTCIPATGGSATELSATDAWGRAAVGDSNSLCCQQRKVSKKYLKLPTVRPSKIPVAYWKLIKPWRIDGSVPVPTVSLCRTLRKDKGGLRVPGATLQCGRSRGSLPSWANLASSHTSALHATT